MGGKLEIPGLKIQKQTVDRNKKFGYIKYDKQGYNRYQASMFESTYKVGEMKGLKQGIEVGRKEGIETGLKEGIETGQKDKTLEMAKKLKEIGMELPLIAKVSGLSQDEIINL